MSPRTRRSLVEPLGLFAGSLVGSAALWGRLWVTAPSTHGICGCGDPSLFQWFLAWPEHAIATGHSLVSSRDLFYPHGVNLLANTSVLALGVPLAPVTWLGGPLLTENVALLLAVPFAVWTMDLFLRRVTDAVVARVVLSVVFGFSPFVLVSLSEAHLMTAWIGFLPLIALGVVDSVSADRSRARRGQLLLGGAIVAQFFIGTELLVLAAIVAALVVVVLAVTWRVTASVPRPTKGAVARLAWSVGLAAVVLAVPAAYALAGPRNLRGKIWGASFNPSANGTSLLALVAPSPTAKNTLAISGYSGPTIVHLQYLGWGLVAVAAITVAWRWRDAVVRTAAIVAAACALLALSPTSVSWAPWRWAVRLPLLENVVQRRFAVFCLLACLVIVARGVGALARHGRLGVLGGAIALGVVVVSIAVPEAGALPLRTVAVATPTWWQLPPSRGVILSYPFPGTTIESPLGWQASSGFTVPLVGGSGPQATPARAGADAAATTVLDELSFPLLGHVVASASTAALVRSLVRRDGVTDVVVPVVVRGSALVTGGPSAYAATLFAEWLGLSPSIVRGAWVFAVTGPLPAPRLLTARAASHCAVLATAAPDRLGPCVLGAPR